MQIKIVNKSTNELPKYETISSAGCDLRAHLAEIKEKCLFNSEVVYNLDNTIAYIQIHPGGRALIPTGLHVALPHGYEGMVRPRSGLALKYGITVLNTPGCVDSDYRGDIGIVLINHGTESFKVEQGDRIAQFIISKVEHVEWDLVDTLDETERGEGGFGHTNIQ